MKHKMLKIAAMTACSFAIGTESFATEWNVSLWGKRRAFTEHVEKLAELVSEKTGGAFTLNISYGGLSKNRENLDGISIGAFEMAQFCAGYHADKNPSITVLELPFLGVGLMPSPMPQYNIAGVGDAPKSLADFDGLTVRATRGIGKAMEMVGAVPTSMTSSEARQAIDSGVVKSVAFAPHAHMAFATIDASSWWTTNLNPGTVNCPVVANTDALASLSDSERDALLGSIDEALDYYVANYEGNTMGKWGPLLAEKGIEEVTYEQAEIDAFREKAAGPIAAAWIEDNTARGLPAQELYDLVIETIAK